jgi:colanic acid/amylovoran biosynthesis glycosyltransferase
VRVVLVVHCFPQLSEAFIVDKFVGLVDRGVDVHITCRSVDSTMWARFPALARRPELRQLVHEWPTARRPLRTARAIAAVALALLQRSRRPGVLGWAAVQLRRSPARFLRELVRDGWFLVLRPDVVHFEFGSGAADRGDLPALVGCKLTVSFRGLDLNYWGLDDTSAYDQLWPRLDAVHVLGEDLWRRARQRGCPPTMAHSTIAPAVDTAFFSPDAAPDPGSAGARDRPLRLLSVGRLHWKKGYEFAMEAVSLVRATGLAVEYRVVGGGPDEDAVRAAAADLAVADVVTFVGARPREVVRDELGAADILVHPAVSEGFSNAVLEAQAMGVPVVCTDADGLAENVFDGVTGFVVHRRDARAMAERILALAHDPGLRARLGTAGRQRALRLTPAAQLDAWQVFYGALHRE